jgi:hypothetical protein
MGSKPGYQAFGLGFAHLTVRKKRGFPGDPIRLAPEPVCKLVGIPNTLFISLSQTGCRRKGCHECRYTLTRLRFAFPNPTNQLPATIASDPGLMQIILGGDFLFEPELFNLAVKLHYMAFNGIDF